MQKIRQARRGVVLIQVALMIVVLLGFVALTTDYGLMVVRQRRLQNVTDSAALAAGPELGKPIAIPEAIALQYAGYYNADATAAAIPFKITVTAQEPVSTPFAHVLNSAWGSKIVHATSVVDATLDFSAGAQLLRPVSFLAGKVGPSGADKYANGQLVHLSLQLSSDSSGRLSYDQNNASIDASGLLTASFFPVDIHAWGIGGTPEAIATARSHYIISLKGKPDTLNPDLKGGTYWLQPMMFVPYTKQSDADWPLNLQNWRNDTYRAIEEDTSLSGDGGASIMEQVRQRKGMGEKLPDFPGDHAGVDGWPTWPADNDPRLCVYQECNRDTGTVIKDYNTALQGFLGFFITGMSLDKTTVTGYIVNPVVRSRTPPTGTPLPPVNNYGIYTYGLSYTN